MPGQKLGLLLICTCTCPFTAPFYGLGLRRRQKRGWRFFPTSSPTASL
jgi:hypothetical protein